MQRRYVESDRDYKYIDLMFETSEYRSGCWQGFYFRRDVDVERRTIQTYLTPVGYDCSACLGCSDYFSYVVSLD